MDKRNEEKTIMLPNHFITRITNKKQLIYLIRRYGWNSSNINHNRKEILKIIDDVWDSKHLINAKYVYVRIKDSIIQGYDVYLKFYNDNFPNVPRVRFIKVHSNEREMLIKDMIKWIKEVK